MVGLKIFSIGSKTLDVIFLIVDVCYFGVVAGEIAGIYCSSSNFFSFSM